MANFCSNCGHEVNGNFCSNCGTSANIHTDSDHFIQINGINLNIAEIIAKYGKNKISAIKYVKDTTGASLQDSKNFVDHAYENLSISDAMEFMEQSNPTDQNRIKKYESEKTPYCPKCHSTSLSANKKGFGVGKAILGGLLAGPIGLLAGTFQSSKVRVTCLNCGNQFEMGK